MIKKPKDNGPRFDVLPERFGEILNAEGMTQSELLYDVAAENIVTEKRAAEKRISLEDAIQELKRENILYGTNDVIVQIAGDVTQAVSSQAMGDYIVGLVGAALDFSGRPRRIQALDERLVQFQPHVETSNPEVEITQRDLCDRVKTGVGDYLLDSSMKVASVEIGYNKENECIALVVKLGYDHSKMASEDEIQARKDSWLPRE